MREYEIHLLKDKRNRSFGLLAWLLISSNIIVLLYFAIVQHRLEQISFAFFPTLLFVGFLIAYRLIKKKPFFGVFELLPAFQLVAVCWLLFGFYFLAIMNMIVGVLAFLALRTKSIVFSADQIKLNVFLTRPSQWETVNNVVLKDNILTIDYKNNKLLQQEIDETISRVNEKEFNDFCKEQLGK